MSKIVNGKLIYKSDSQTAQQLSELPYKAPYKHRRQRVSDSADKPSPGKEWISWLVLPLALICYEIIFRQATGEQILCVQMLAAAAASLIIGTVLFCFCSLFRRPGINRAVKAVLLLLTALPFMVQYYVFRAFKTFYDVRTIIAGTNDVVGKGFLEEALDTVLNRTGLIYLGLFLLPFLLYITVIRRADPAAQFRGRTVLRTVCILIFSAGCAAAIVLYVPGLQDHLYRFYSYANAANSYGLLPGMCLDVIEGGNSRVSFDEVDPPAARPAQEEVVDKDVSVIYKPNVLNIDFAELAETSPEPYSSIDAYVAMQIPTMQNEYTGLFEGKNLIMITAEAFTAEVIDAERTPTLYRLATKGINFTDFMQSATAGTIGGEFQVIFGMPSVRGGASFEYLLNDYNCQTMGWQLNERGYYGIAFHNNDYTFYNRNKTHNVLGYSEGFYGYGNGLEEFLTDTFPKSDLELMEGTVDWYIGHQPFNVYYMTFSGHNSYNFRYNDMSWKNREYVEDLPYSEIVRAYLAANMELEHALTYLVGRLEEAGIADDTVIVLCADHFPYGLDYEATIGNMPCLSELYGYDVDNYMDRDHNRLIIWSGCLEDGDPIIVDSPTSSLDILPTLLNLFGLDYDSRLFVGRDVFSDADPLVFDLFYNWKTDFGRYLSSTGTFEPYDEDAVIPEGYVDRMKTVVKNKIKYCEAVVDNDYFRHVMENYDPGSEGLLH